MGILAAGNDFITTATKMPESDVDASARSAGQRSRAMSKATKDEK